MLLFNIHHVKISLNGQGKLFDYFKFQFRHFIIDEVNDRKIDIKLIVETNSGKNFKIRNKQKIDENIYCFAFKKKFIWEVANNFLILPYEINILKTNTVIVDGNFSKMHFNIIFDFILRLYFIKKGFVLVHAACVSKNNHGILLPAWKAIGKTELSLKLVENGYSFLGDDKIWIDKDGNILSFPRYVVIKESNAKSFEYLFNKFYFVKLYLKTFLTIKNKDQKIFIIYNAVINRLFKLKILHLPIEELYPSSITIQKTKLSQVFFLTKDKTTNIENLSSGTIKKLVQSTNNLEWNNYLFKLVSSIDLMLPENSSSWTDKFFNLIYYEDKILFKVLNDRIGFKLNLGKYRKWNEIVDMINEKS